MFKIIEYYATHAKLENITKLWGQGLKRVLLFVTEALPLKEF